MSGVTILLLAAGASRRMGGVDKLLQQVGGQALLRRQALAALATGAPVIVALPPHAKGRLAVLAGLPVAVIEVARASDGMGASLATGTLAAGEPEGLMVMLADMPEIEAGDIATLITAFKAANGQQVIRAAAADGSPGHPVIFPADCLPTLCALTGDTGARAVLRANVHRTVLVPLPGQRATTDLDTPEAWAEWRAANPHGKET